MRAQVGAILLANWSILPDLDMRNMSQASNWTKILELEGVSHRLKPVSSDNLDLQQRNLFVVQQPHCWQRSIYPTVLGHHVSSSWQQRPRDVEHGRDDGQADDDSIGSTSVPM